MSEHSHRQASEAMAIANEIIEIMKTYDEQEAEGCIDTPGGLEHMGDVWRLLGGWRDRLAKGRAQR